MLLEEISVEDSKIILEELCKAVGTTYDKVDFDKPEWYTTHTWTVEEQLAFQKWLGEFLVKNHYAMKGNYRKQPHGFYEAGKMLMNYGWKFKS